MDQPSEPTEYQPQPVDDLEEFRKERLNQSPDAIEADLLNNAELAHLKLTKWGHMSSLPNILTVIGLDLTGEKPDEPPSAKLLRNLLANSSLYENFQTEDPFAEDIAHALQNADTPEKLEALEAVRKLHKIMLSRGDVSRHVLPIIRAILAAPTRLE